MQRTILGVILTLLASSLVMAQTPNPPSTQEILSRMLADLRGLAETVDISGAENVSDRTQGKFSIIDGPLVTTASLPSQKRSSPGTVSAKRLRHQAPKAARAAYESAIRLHLAKDNQKAAALLEKAIALDPDFPEAHDDLGVAYAWLHRYPEAEEEFRRAIALIPEESLPHSNLGWVLFETGQRAEAETSVRHAIQLSPENASAHMLMGRLLIENPQTLQEGLGYLEFAARTIPDASRMIEILQNGK